MSEQAKCGLCGEPMPEGEEMFGYHGYSGPCPVADPRAAGAPCPNCNGDGKEYSPYRRCIVCRGTGKVAGAPAGEPLGDPLAVAIKGLERIQRLTGMRSDCPTAAAQTLAEIARLRAPSAAGDGEPFDEADNLAANPFKWRFTLAEMKAEYERGYAAALAGRSRAPEPVKAEFRNSCNIHEDCKAADEAVKESGGTRATHCHDDCCEDCFGK